MTFKIELLIAWLEKIRLFESFSFTPVNPNAMVEGKIFTFKGTLKGGYTDVVYTNRTEGELLEYFATLYAARDYIMRVERKEA